MKASKEVRKFYKFLVRRYGKKNGVIPGAVLDIPKLERMEAQNAKQKKLERNKKTVDI